MTEDFYSFVDFDMASIKWALAIILTIQMVNHTHGQASKYLNILNHHSDLLEKAVSLMTEQTIIMESVHNHPISKVRSMHRPFS